MRPLRKLFVFIGLFACAPAVAYGQASIVGSVRDTSGAVLPGVTVEASSPALIEKVRSAVTDGSGQYRIENLQPGPYTVTFTLPGFSVIKREGDGVRARLQVPDPVAAGSVGHRGSDLFNQRRARGLDRDARQHRARRIPDAADNRRLAVGHGGRADEQPDEHEQLPEWTHTATSTS